MANSEQQRERDLKLVYSIKAIKPIENKEEFNMAFPILFPNTNYFGDLQSILNSYGIVLQSLADLDYNIEEYLESVKNNTMLSSFYKETSFEVKEGLISYEEEEGVLSEDNTNEEYLDMVVSEETGEVVFGIKYNNQRFRIIDTKEQLEYQSMLYIDLDYLDLYFTGSYCYINDKKNTKQYFVYLD